MPDKITIEISGSWGRRKLFQRIRDLFKPEIPTFVARIKVFDVWSTPILKIEDMKGLAGLCVEQIQ